jgi:hypothetical protein
VDLVIKRELWPLEPASAEELLKRLGHVRRETSVPHALSLVGGPTGSVARFEVSYSEGDDGHWTFNAANFFLGDAELATLYRKLETRITERLGKPAWTEKQNDLPSTGWSLGRYCSGNCAPQGGEPRVAFLTTDREVVGRSERWTANHWPR